MDQAIFLDLLNALLIHAHQLCLIEDAKQPAEFIQQTDAVLRYYSKPQETVLLSKEIDILKKYVHLYSMVENRVHNIKLEIDDNIDQRNIFVQRLILIDWMQEFIRTCLSEKQQVIKLNIKLSIEANKIRFDLGSSIGCADSYLIDTGVNPTSLTGSKECTQY